MHLGRTHNMPSACYQISGRKESGLTIASPGLQPNAAANCGIFESGPLILHCRGACRAV